MVTKIYFSFNNRRGFSHFGSRTLEPAGGFSMSDWPWRFSQRRIAYWCVNGERNSRCSISSCHCCAEGGEQRESQGRILRHRIPLKDCSILPILQSQSPLQREFSGMLLVCLRHPWSTHNPMHTMLSRSFKMANLSNDTGWKKITLNLK